MDIASKLVPAKVHNICRLRHSYSVSDLLALYRVRSFCPPVCPLVTIAHCGKTAEPIELPFEMVIGVHERKVKDKRPYLENQLDTAGVSIRYRLTTESRVIVPMVVVTVTA